MKSYFSIIVFLAFSFSAGFSSIHSYRCAEGEMVSDMNQALTKTLSEKTEGWITPDTIQNYREHLRITALRNHSFVYYAMDSHQGILCSKKMQWRSKVKSVVFQSYANCSMATIWGLSDQHISISLSVMALLWGMLSLFYFKRNYDEMDVFGGLMYLASEHCFYNIHRERVIFTPMQLQLMQMFYEKDNHLLTKQEICNALWPKKPDASATMYTLIKRLKPIIGQKTNLKIVSDRNGYRLTTKRLSKLVKF